MSRAVIGVDIGTRYIRAVALCRRTRAWSLAAADTFQLPENAQLSHRLTAAHDWIAAFLRPFATGQVVVSLPAEDCITKILRLPPSSSRQLIGELVAFEANHELPFGGRQPAWSFQDLESGRNATTVLIAAADLDTTEQIARWIQGQPQRTREGDPGRLWEFGRRGGNRSRLPRLATITVCEIARLALLAEMYSRRNEISKGDLAVRLAGLIRLRSAGRPDDTRNLRAAAEDPPGSFAVIAAQDDRVEVLTFADGRLQTSHLRVFSQDISKEERLTETVRHVGTSLQAQRAAERAAQKGICATSNLTTAILYCSAPEVWPLRERLEEETGMRVAPLGAWDGLVVEGSTAAAVPAADRNSYACATGLALVGGDGRWRLNLLAACSPAGASPSIHRALQVGLRSCAAAAIGVSLWFAVLYSPFSPYRVTAPLERRYARARLLLAVARRDAATAALSTLSARPPATLLDSVASKLRADTLIAPELLRLLSKNLPAGIRVDDLSISPGGAMLRGVAPDNLVLAEALESLRSVPLTADVHLASTDSTTVQGARWVRFEIALHFAEDGVRPKREPSVNNPGSPSPITREM